MTDLEDYQEEDVLEEWTACVAHILRSTDPYKNLALFLLDFETEVYNRALSDSLANINDLDHADKGVFMGKIMALRLGKLPQIPPPPEIRSDVVLLTDTPSIKQME